MTSTQSQSLMTPAFKLLCLIQLLGYAQHFILQPTLPLYITDLGGSALTVGLVLAAFGAASVLSRPIIGYWADRWSETRVLISGLFFQGLCVSLCFIPVVGVTMLANGLRGIGWSGMTTGGYMVLASSAPAGRRGEASGYFSGAQSVATIIFPAVALWIINASFGGFIAVFFIAIMLALAGAGAGMALSRHIAHAPRQVQTVQSESWWHEIISMFDRHIVLAAALLFVSHLSGPCLTSFTVLYAQELNISHFAWFFVVSGVTSVLARPLLGRFSDRIGCGSSLIAAFTVESIGLVILPFVPNLFGMMVSGVLYFMGSALATTRILALAMDKAPVERRGRAMASFSISFPLSNGVGALLNGLIINLAGFFWMYIISALICASGLVLIARNWSNLK